MLEGINEVGTIELDLFFFGTMGGVFLIITGCVVGFSAYNKIKEGEIRQSQIASSGTVKGVILV